MKAKLLSFVMGLKTGTPPRFQSYLKSLTLLLVLMLSVGNVWGDVTIKTTTITNPALQNNNYGSYKDKPASTTIGGVAFSAQDIAYNSNGTPEGIAINQSIQIKKTTGYITNTQSLSLSSLVIVCFNTNFTVSAGTTTENLTSVTGTQTTETVSLYTYVNKKVSTDPSDKTLTKITYNLSGKNYFKIAASSSAAQIYSIVATTASGYDITYECNGATSGCPEKATGQTALPNPLPTGVTKTGYTFAGWFTNEGLTIAAVAGAEISANTTLYAKWQSSKTKVSAPTNLSTSNVSFNSATLSWSAPSTTTGIASYKVEYKTSAESSWTVAQNTAATTCSLTGLTAGTKYNWRVTSITSDDTQYDNSDAVNGTDFTTTAITVTSLSQSGTLTKTAYTAGESFNPAGLTIAAHYNNETQAYVTDQVVWSPDPLTQGITSVMGTFGGKQIEVNGISVVAPIIVTLNYTNTPFTSTSSSNDATETVEVDDIEYTNYAGYNYTNGSTLSFNKSKNGYLGNKTAFCGNIQKIVVTFTSDVKSKFTMYEGASTLAETTTVEYSSYASNVATYTFSGNNAFFKLKLTTTGSYVNISSIQIYLKACNKTVLTAPTALTNGTITAKTAALSWTAGDAEHTGSYLVEYKTSSAEEWESEETNETSISLSDLDPETTYNWRVTARPNDASKADYQKSEAANGTNFTTSALQTFNLKFYNNGVQVSSTIHVTEGNKIGDKLPDMSGVTSCDETSTIFAGWTTEEIKTASATVDADKYVDYWTVPTEDMDINALWATSDPKTVTFDVSDRSNLTAGTNKYTETTSGIVMGAGVLTTNSTYFRSSADADDDIYLYLDGNNKVIQKYVVTVDGTVTTYGIGSVSDGSISTSSSVQTISEVNSIYPEAYAYSGKTSIDFKKVVVTTYTNYLTHCCTKWTAPTFTYDPATIAVGGGTLTPTIGESATYGARTFASSDPDIATVNETTGVVTPVKPGQVTITASWAGDEDHCAVDKESNQLTITGTLTVEFYKNGEDVTGTMENQEVNYNVATKIKKNVFEKPGHDFAGWRVGETETIYGDEEVVQFTEDTKLYAQWTPRKHSVSFTNEYTGGTVTVNSSSTSPVENVTYNSVVTVATTDNTHYTLATLTYQVAGQEAVDIKEAKQFNMPDADVTIAATWTPDPTYTVTFHTGNTSSTQTNVWNGTLFSEIKPENPAGSAAGDCADSFVGWAISAINGTTDKDGYDAIKVTAETAVSESQTDFYAVFATGQGGEESKAVTLSNGVYSGSSTTGKITWTETGIVTILQEKGNSSSNVNSSYVSAPRWYSSHVITITPSKVITKIDVTTADAGHATKLAGSTYTNATAAVDQTTNTLVHITPTNGSQVITITMGDQSRPTAITVYYDNKTYANYVTTCCQKYNITLTDAGTKTGGTFSASPSSACAGTEITLTANPATGYEFKSWTTSPEQTITDNKFEMPAEAVTVDATFALQKHNVTLHYNNNEDPEVTDVTEFTYGVPQNLKTLETLKWSAPTGYNFGGWATTASGTGVYEDGYLYTLTAENDVDLYASWVEESLRSISYTQVDHLTYGTNPETISKDAKGFVVAYTVDAHYQVTNATVTVNGVTLTEGVTVGQNGLTVEKNGFEGPVVVTPTVAPITYNVIWSANGSQFATNTVQQGSKPTLPDSEPTTCGTGVVFMGWTDSTIDDQATAPAVLFKDAAAAPTVETATENTVTFYAVYAEQSGTGEMVDVELARAEYDTWTIGGTGTTTDKSTYLLMGENSYAETTTSFDLGKITKVVVYGGTFGGDSYKNIVISDGTTTWKDTTVTGKKETGVNTYIVSPNPLSGTGKLRVASRSGDGSSNGVRLSKFIAYTQAKDYTYAHYSTTCVPPVVAPTITTVAGSYCGSVNVEISKGENPEGAAIYYTTDATAEPVVWTAYPEGGINLETIGATTITAKVTYLTKTSETDSKTFTVLKTYADLATAKPDTIGGSKNACLTFKVLVNGAAARDIFVQDEAGNAYEIYSSSTGHGIKAGDTLTANSVQTSFTKLNNTIKVTYTTDITKTTPASPVTTPTVKTISEITADDFGKLIKIESVHVDSVDDKTFKFYYEGGTDTIAANNTFMPTLPKWRNTAWYDVTGIIILDANGNPTIAPRNNSADMQSKAVALSAPTVLAVENITGASAKLSWSEVEHAQKYTVVVKKNGTKEKESTTTNSYYTPSGLTAGTAYTWTVKAIGDKLSYNDSPESEAGSFTTLKAATIKWMVNGSEYETTYADNEKAVLPEINPTSGCAELYSDFICWVNRPVEGVQTRAPYNYELVTDTTKAKSAVSGGDTIYTFYALFGKVETPASYDLVESALADWRGQYLIAYSDGIFMDGSLAGGTNDGQIGAANTSVAPGTHLSSDKKKVDAEWGDDHFLTIEAVNDKDLTKGYVLATQNAFNTYINRTTNSNGMNVAATKSAASNDPLTITFSSSTNFCIVSSAGPTLHYNNSDGIFRFYKDAGQKPVYVYRYGAPTYSAYITTCPSTYSVTIDDQVVGGTITADPMTNVEAGAKVTVTAEPSAGYTTGTWNVTDGESQPVEVKNGEFKMPTSNVTVSYTFTALVDQFVDNLHGNTEQSASGDATAGYEIPSLSSTTAGAKCDAYYQFIGWVEQDINSGEPATTQPTIFAGTYATGTTYNALWKDGTGRYITECCNTAVPTNLHSLSTYLKATSAKLDWNNVTGATKYHVLVLDDGAETVADADVTDSEYALVGLTANTTYTATVKAYVGCWGFETEELEFTTAEEVQKYAVTINATNGTYSISPALDNGKIKEGQTVTISDIAPADADHYFKDLTITPEVADLIEVDGSYMFTMPGNAITIDINFPAIPVITWKVEGKTTATVKAVQTSGTTNFTVGTIKAAPTTWSYKDEFYKDFAGWLVGEEVSNPVFANAGTAVPAEGLTLNAAFAKSASVDFDNLVKIESNESLDFGAKYVIGGEYNSDTAYMYEYNVNDKWGYMSADVETNKPMLFTIDGTAAALAIRSTDGLYIEGNATKTFSMSEERKEVGLDASGVIYKINSESWTLRYNTTESGLRWYSSATGEQPYLYKATMLYDYLTIAPTEQLKKRVINVDEYSTICLEQGAKAEDIFGLSLWTIEKATWNDTKLYSITIVQHEGDMVAGMPYIVCGEESENDLHAVVVSGDAVGTPVTEGTNGLVGSFVKVPFDNIPGYDPTNSGYYVISNGTLYLCGKNSGIYDHRAYIKADEIEDLSAKSAPMAVRRTIGGKDSPTMLENIIGSGDKIQKFVIDNQLIIIRNGRIYNSAGALVK